MDRGKLARQKYDKLNTTQVTLKLNKKTDSDVLKRLKEVPAKQTYIKRLIREDIARGDKGILFDPFEQESHDKK